MTYHPTTTALLRVRALSILCGLAVGYSDPEFAANKLKIGRQPIGENAVFLDS